MTVLRIELKLFTVDKKIYMISRLLFNLLKESNTGI